jgi:cell division protein FtsL
LESENERLQVERRAQATPLRVEKLAKEQLHMRSVTPAITDYVIANGASGVSGVSGVSAVQPAPASPTTGRAP